MSMSTAELSQELSFSERAACEAVEGTIFDIQRYSLHDGPGLRTNVFFKGCPLRCGWCSNPESQHAPPELAVFASQCIACGQFAEACPDRWQVAPDEGWKRELRDEYGKRAVLCPAGGVRWIGERRTAGEVLAEVRRDAAFYQDGGGMTLTGGEPVLQPQFAEALLRLARADCIHTAIETCGHYPWPALERLLPYLDLVLFDVKHMDSAVHRAHTGVGNEIILANLRRLASVGAPVIVRVPLIPGLNSDAASVRAIGELVANLDGGIGRIDVLPYHTLARAKYAALARPYPWAGHTSLPDSAVAGLAGVLRDLGLDVSIGG
jgi:pyruvate formate lyase activating enzyme